MRTRTFLTPMTPDGKPGELVQVRVNDTQQEYMTPDGKVVTVAVQSIGQQEYMAPVAYTTNDKNVSDLRAQVAKAEAELRHAHSRGLDPLRLRRYEDALESARRELLEAEAPRREERQRQRTGGDDAPPTRNTLVRNAGSFDTWLTRFDADMLGKARKMATYWGPYQPAT